MFGTCGMMGLLPQEMGLAVNIEGKSKVWYREPWPWLLMAGPTAVILAGSVTLYYAIKSNDGLVEDDYYKQGLAVNQRIARDHRAATLGLSAEANLEGLAVSVAVTSGKLAKLPPFLTLKVVRPTHAGLDQTVNLSGDGKGAYTGSLQQALLQGKWQLSLEDPEQEWRLLGDMRSESAQKVKLEAAPVVSP